MFKRWHTPLIFAIILLGIFGLIATLWENPVQMIRNILIFGIVIGIGFLLYRRFLRKQNGNETSLYRRAARQSKKRLKRKSALRVSHLKLIRSQPDHERKILQHPRHKNGEHLRVIEGKKRKKKNRALF